MQGGVQVAVQRSMGPPGTGNVEEGAQQAGFFLKKPPRGPMGSGQGMARGGQRAKRRARWTAQADRQQTVPGHEPHPLPGGPTYLSSRTGVANDQSRQLVRPPKCA